MVATRHGEAQAEQEEALHHNAPATRSSRHHADAGGGSHPGQAVAAAAARLARPAARASRHAPQLHDSEIEDTGIEGAADEDGSSDPAASEGEEDGPHTTGGRSARAGRSLRNNIKKPPPQHLIQTFTKAPTPHRPASRAERQQRQRERKRQQRQQELQLQELQYQERELQNALRAAAGGSHLTRHQTRLLRVWAEDAADIEPATVDAAAGGDADAAELLAAAAAEAIVKSEPGSEAAEEDEEEAGSSEGDGHADREEGEEEGAEAGPAAAGSSKRRQSQTAGRGLRAELLQLKQAAAEAKAAERRRRQREAIRQAARQQRILRDTRLGGSRRGSFDNVVLEYSSDEELGEDTSSQDTGAGRSRGGRGGGRLRKRGRAAAWSEGSDGDDEGEGEDEDEDEGRRKYKLRSRDRVHAERLINEHPAPAARPRARARDRHRAHVKLGLGQNLGRGSARRRGGFSELSSDDPDDSLFPGGHWSRLLGPAAAGRMTGPFYAPAALPPTPAAAAAVAAAATAAAGGMLSPRGASLDRRGSVFLDAAPGTASRTVGSGWAHWGASGGGGGEGGPAYGGGAAAAAAAAAGGTAADKRGAGLGQELITPLQVDPSIDFDQIGGLDQYLSALKEMVFLPLLYPEIFDKFGVNPPRGVLFHGPPGTGKTLVARALAAQASRAAGQKVSFYMRKGADLLSKWVGEAEKQLRLLFEEASKHQPAIIFFDEIDGLAPVRTSKQDQVHNSIVSTLLALMDGLESRGRVVLIGATNRPDALDPALRRPGRFDRELLFPMPDLAARRSILAIHSRRWAPQPPPTLLDDLAQLTGGYCGADLRALCAEASLAALRRVYPQIYASDVKLLIDTSAVRVTRQDFITAMQDLTPAAHRATASHAKALNAVIQPCLAHPLQSALSQIRQLFPPAAACMAQTAAAAAAAGGSNLTATNSSSRGLPKAGSNSSSSRHVMHIARPRMLLVGPPGSGQQQLGAAVLAAVEGLPVHCIGLTSLLANVAARCVEEALVSAFTEARRSAPAIIYWPQAHLWWAAAGSGLRCGLVALLDDLPPDLPLMLLATAELPADTAAAAALPSSSSRRLLTAPGAAAAAAAGGGAAGRSMQQQRMQQQQEYLEELGMDPSLAALFPPLGQVSDTQGQQLQDVHVHASTPAAQQGQTAAQGQHQQDAGVGCDVLGWVLLDSPGPNERRGMFKAVFDAAAAPPLPEDDGPQQQAPAQLPPAPDAAAAAEAQRKAEEAAAARVAYEEDQAVLRSLRMVLRGIVQRALTVKRYRLFAEPPMLDDEEGMQAMQCLSHPMDLLTMLYKVDHQQYVTPAAFLADAHLIVKCAEELYGQTDEAALIPAPPPAAAAAARVSGATAAAAPAAAGAAGSGSRDVDGGAAAAVSASAAAAAAAGGEEPMVCSPGRQAGGPAAAAAAGDAGAVHDPTDPAAAAAAVPVLPMLRVSVCKEISRAMELKDGLEQQVYQLVPPELAQACEAIAARGGPAPPPPGMVLPQQLLPASLPSSMAAARPAADASNKQSNLRTTARLTGQKLDKRLLHADPEALMRARKQSKAKAAAQLVAAAAEPDEHPAADQQQQQEEGQPQQEQEEEGQLPAAAADVEMADVTEADLGAAAAAAAGQSAAADASTAAAAGTQQQPLHLEECPAALKPVTNGVSRKRRNSSAEAAAAADFEASRPTKAARHTLTAEQQGASGLLHGSSSVQPAPAAKLVPPAADPQPDMQAAGQQGDQPQQQQQQMAAEGDEGEAVPVQPVLSTHLKAAAVADVLRAEQLLDRVVVASEGLRLAALELLHARLSRVVAANCQQEDRSVVLGKLAHIIDGLQQSG